MRELDWCEEFESQLWAKMMQDLLVEIKEEKNKTGFVTIEGQSYFQSNYRAILKQGQKECPFTKKPDGKRGRTANSKSRNLLERLLNFEEETLRFMRDPDVPFTNKQGENDIRMTKVRLKISGCFRSMEGQRTFVEYAVTSQLVEKMGLT